MAIPHASPAEVFDVRPLGDTLRGSVTTTLIKTPRLEMLRLVLPTGKEIPPHTAQGEVTIHCLEGRVAFSALGRSQELTAGQLIHLAGGTEHSVRGVEDASVLVTIQLAPRPATTHTGGAGHK